MYIVLLFAILYIGTEATLDGNAVNRRLMKMHDQGDLVYKTRNPFADDGREFFFFSGPPTSRENHSKLLVFEKPKVMGKLVYKYNM